MITNILQDIQHAGFELLRDLGEAENVILRRNVFEIIDPVRDIKNLVETIEITTIGHTRRFTNEEREAGLTVSGETVWILSGFPITAQSFRPAIADIVISPTLGEYVVSTILYEDNIGRMNYEVMARFSNQSSGGT